MQNIVVLHGPNMNLLGTREPELYGNVSLKEINDNLIEIAESQNIKLEGYQTNSEEKLIDMIHQSHTADYLIINAGGLAHTSICLRDAIAAINVPFIEVHLTNIYAREKFRNHSYLSEIAEGVICGLGPVAYELALAAILAKI